MKFNFLIFLLLLSFFAKGQSLNNTQWRKVDAIRKDGSTIIDRTDFKNSWLEYKFEDTEVEIVTSSTRSYRSGFSVIGSTPYLTYQIDHFDDLKLLLTEIPKQPVAPDRINTLTLIRQNHYFEYLLNVGEIEILSDTLILCNEKFSAYYEGKNLNQILSNELSEVSSSFYGYFILTPDGNMESVHISPDANIKNKDADKFKKILLETSGLWSLPQVPKPYYFKVDFELRFFKIMSVPNINLDVTLKKYQIEYPSLSVEDKRNADLHYNKGLKYLSGKKNSQAIAEFQKVLAIDPIYLDAYYNLAHLHSTNGDNKSACDIWEKLKLLGQKQGEQLLIENCQ